MLSWINLITLFRRKKKPSNAARLKQARSAHYHRTMNELDRATEQIYVFLSRPENAALRTSILNGAQDFGNYTAGQALIKKMNLSIAFGPNFYDAMQYAISRLKKDELTRPTPPPPPAPRFDVVLTDAGRSSIRILTMVKDIAKIGLKEARDRVDNVPSTILTGADQADAELVQEILQDAGAVVELIAAEPQD